MKPSVQSLTPEQKRAMLARLLKQQPAVSKAAYMLQALILDCIMSKVPVWNMRSTIRFFNKVDPELLRARIQKVIDRHPVLRTTYEIAKGRELDCHSQIFLMRLGVQKLRDLYVQNYIDQRVHPQHSVHFTVVDASEWTAEQLRQRLLEDALETYAYDCSELPVCRFRLYQRKTEDVIQFDVHHCAGDLWSLEVIVEELEDPVEGPPPPSFAEFSAWQHAWMTLPKAAEMRKWWMKYLKGCPPLCLGISAVDDPAEVALFEIEADLVAEARQVCRKYKITFFNMVLSTLQATLSHFLSISDFAIGGAMANRPNQQFENTVGFLAHFVVYRRNLSLVQTWEQLWAANRTTVADLIERQFYPMVTLPLPATDVYISYHQYQKARWLENPPQGEELGLRSGGVVNGPLGPREYVFVELPVTPSPLMFEFAELKEGLQGIFRYRTTCFSKKKAELYIQDFMGRLRASLANPGASFNEDPS